MPNILDRYAHDFRGIRMGEKELRKMLKAFVMELLPGEQPCTGPVFSGYNSCRFEILKKIGEK